MPAERDAVVTACAGDLFFRFLVFWGVSLADILVLICNIQNRKTNFENRSGFGFWSSGLHSGLPVAGVLVVRSVGFLSCAEWL